MYLTLWCNATIRANYFTNVNHQNLLRNQALFEHKSIVSGRMLGLRLTILPLTIDSDSPKTPIYGDSTDA